MASRMARFWAIAAFVLLPQPALTRADDASIASAIAGAETLLANDDASRAIASLEKIVPKTRGEQRTRALESLADAYRKGAEVLEKSGEREKAAEYRLRLGIIERKGSPKVPRQQTRAQSMELALPPVPPASAKVSLIASSASDAPDLFADPSPVQPTTPSPPVAEKLDVTVEPAVAEADTRPALSPAPTTCQQADAHFRENRFAEAGRLYGELAKAEQLPQSRKEAWAYCRRHAVVQRINEGPKDAREWRSLLTEVDAIQKIEPMHWYDEYLRSLLTEMSRKAPAGDRDKPVLRGASPDEPLQTQQPRTRESRSGPRFPTVKRSTERALAVRESANFKVIATDPALAQRASEIAEAARAVQIERWAQAGFVFGLWSAACEIQVHETSESFSNSTGEPADLLALSRVSRSGNRVNSRRIDVQGTGKSSLETLVAHEVSHVVVADLLSTQVAPRWMDEGLAVLAEPAADQTQREHELRQAGEDGLLFSIEEILDERPLGHGRDRIYQSQSASLVRFLLRRSNALKFIEFARELPAAGFDASLQRQFGIADRNELQRQWIDSLRGASESVRS